MFAVHRLSPTVVMVFTCLSLNTLVGCGARETEPVGKWALDKEATIDSCVDELKKEGQGDDVRLISETQSMTLTLELHEDHTATGSEGQSSQVGTWQFSGDGAVLVSQPGQKKPTQLIFKDGKLYSEGVLPPPCVIILRREGDTRPFIPKKRDAAQPERSIKTSGGSPDAEDIRKAVENEIKSNPLAAMMVASLESVEVLGCKEVPDKPGYNCDYKAVSVASNGEKMPAGLASARFVKGKTGWILVK